MSRGRARRAVFIAAALGALLLPACSGSDEPVTTSTTVDEGRGGVNTRVWAVQFCAAFDSWLAGLEGELTRVSARVGPGDLTAGRAAIEALFARSATQTSELLRALDDGGAPDVPGGVAFVRALRGRVAAFRSAMVRARADAAALPARDAAALQLGTAALVNRYEQRIDEASRALADLDRDRVDPDLRDALLASCAS